MRETDYCLNFHRKQKKNNIDFNSSNNKLWWQ